MDIKEKIEVRISLIMLSVLKGIITWLLHDIAPAKGIGSTGITFYFGCPVDVNKMGLR